jgi:thiol:disulfide interchange protein DsbD
MKNLTPLTLLMLFLMFYLPSSSRLQAKDSIGWVKEPHLNLRLVSEETAFSPGQTAMIGIYFAIDRDWHLYWKNPGDSGLAPSIRWILPAGFKAGDLKWPLPEKIQIPSLTDYGYRNQLLLMAPLTVPKHLEEGSAITLQAEVNWLVCNESCLPGKAILTLRLPVARGGDSRTSKFKALFDNEYSRLAGPLPSAWTSKGSATSDGFQLRFTTGSMVVKKADFFPLDPGVVDNNAPVSFENGDSSFDLKLKKSNELMKKPVSLKGLILVWNAKGQKHGFEVEIPLK